MRNADLPELIQRRDFIERQDNSYSYLVSPDGKKLAWIAKKDDFYTLFTKKIDEEESKTVNSDCWCNISWFTWAEDSRHILFLLDTRSKHIYLADTYQPELEPINLTPDAKWGINFLDTFPHEPENILLSFNKRCRYCFDLYRMNINSGKRELLVKNNEDILKWIVDRKGQLIGRKRVTNDNKISFEIHDATDSSWRPALSWGFNETVYFYGCTSDRKKLWLLSNRGRDRMALVNYDLKMSTETVVCENPYADVESLFIDPKTGEPLIAYSYPGYQQIYTLDKEIEKNVLSKLDSV